VVLARRCGDRAILAQALANYASAVSDPTTLQERLAVTAELGTLADELGKLEISWAAAWQRMGALLESANIGGAEQMLCRMNDLASNLRQPYFSWVTDHALVMMAIMAGAPDAEQQLLAAFHVGTAGGQPDAWQAYVSQLSAVTRGGMPN
jgi:hypothetical protein